MRQINILALLVVLVHTGWGNPVLLASKGVGADTSVNCPPGFSQPANSNWTTCYQAFNGYWTKSDAANQCKLNNGTLASVPNAFVNSFIYSIAYSASFIQFWLGVECKNGDRITCKNDDSTQFGYNNFYSGQPSTVGNCVNMAAVGSHPQYWSSYDCSEKLPFVCEAPIKRKAPLGCPSGFDAFNGICYKFVTVKPTLITADQAATYCAQSPGGILAIIASDQVNQFLMSKQYGGNSYTSFGLECPKVKHNGDRRTCYWVDGTSFSYQSFFDANTPEAQEGGGCCDFNKGKWADCWPCNVGKFDSYICQAPMH